MVPDFLCVLCESLTTVRLKILTAKIAKKSREERQGMPIKLGVCFGTHSNISSPSPVPKPASFLLD